MTKTILTHAKLETLFNARVSNTTTAWRCKRDGKQFYVIRFQCNGVDFGAGVSVPAYFPMLLKHIKNPSPENYPLKCGFKTFKAAAAKVKGYRISTK